MTITRRKLLATGAAGLVLTQLGLARAQTAKRGGTLTIGFSVEPAGLDPAFGDAPSLDRSIYNMFYDNLFYLGTDGALQPGLAASWEVAANGLSISARLRAGVVFHDGTPLDAAAVKASLERVIDPG